MTVRLFRAAAAALFFSTVTVMAMPAQAAGGVHAAVGNALKEAQALAAQGNYKAAMSKVQEASAAAKTSDETAIVAKMKEYIGVRSGDPSLGGGPAAKVKFANDNAARRYSDVIADGELLRKYGAMDAQSMQVIAQAYWLSHKPADCIRYIRSNFGNNASADVLQLEMRCAYDAGDTATQREVLENLVARTGSAQDWANLLKMSENAGGWSSLQTLDIYRLKLRTGAMGNGARDYSTLAELALQFHFSAEALAVIKKGVDAKLLADARSQRLLAAAQAAAAADAAGMPKALAAANAARNGDALVTLGEDEWGNGNFAGAVTTVQAGIKKGVTDKDNAQIRLALAYLGAGQKDAALHALAAVKTDPKWVEIAHLWTLYARH
jgi:hypothetical protein